MDWGRVARAIITELEAAVDTAPSRELVELLQRAISDVVKVIHRADDSSGLIGDLARDLRAERRADRWLAEEAGEASRNGRFEGFDQRIARALLRPRLSFYDLIVSRRSSRIGPKLASVRRLPPCEIAAI